MSKLLLRDKDIINNIFSYIYSDTMLVNKYYFDRYLDEITMFDIKIIKDFTLSLHKTTQSSDES